MDNLHFEESRRRKLGFTQFLASLALVISIGALAYRGLSDHPTEGSAQALEEIPYPVYTEVAQTSAMTLDEEVENSRRNAIVRAVEAVEPAVVSINVTEIKEYALRSPFRDELLEWFFPELRRRFRQKVKGIGSGFIINEKGYILTNEHVVHNAVEIIVTLPDGREFQVRDVRRDVRPDPGLDIALIKVDAEDLPFVKLGDSEDVIIGEWAIAIGNPFGLLIKDARPTVTVGVISAVDRDFGIKDGRVYRDMLQTDAVINPGNSGGPLVNSNGEVIGINTFIFIGSQWDKTFIGAGFAIPINRAKKVVNEIIKYGEVRPVWAGIVVQNLSRLMAQSLNLKSTDGVIISEVEPGSPAEKAGLKAGDIIIEVNGQVIRDRDDLRVVFRGATVGEGYLIKVIRQDQEVRADLRLEEAPRRRR